MNAIPGNLPKGLVYHRDLTQGTQEWLEARRGILTASEMKKIITPKLKVADSADSRAHVYEIAAQRITGHVEETFISYDMMRGQEEETDARDHYVKHYAPVDHVGFITNDRWGFTLGYSPDGLVGEIGLIEAKSRKQRFQVETIVKGEVPSEHIIQCQSALLISEREWLHFLSYSGGLPMDLIPVEPIAEFQEAIAEAATAFEARVAEVIDTYHAAVKSRRLYPTERRQSQEMY
ncbi:putative endonuclease [Synechococcus phage Ssp-JY42]|nr:hypothetical protein [Synechococcus phage Yong-M4-211]